MKYLNLWEQALKIWSKVQINPEYLDLVKGSEEHAPLAYAEALNTILAVAGFRPAMLIDAADFHSTSVYGRTGRKGMQPLVQKLLGVLPDFMGSYEDYINSETIARAGTGIYLINKNLISPEEMRGEPGSILGYACAGEQGGQYGVRLYTTTIPDGRRTDVITQTCHEYLSKMPQFSYQVDLLSQFLQSSKLPFEGAGLDIFKYSR